VKLMLPPSLALPTGIAYWLGRCWPAALAVPTVSEGPVSTLSLAMGRYAEPFQNMVAMPAAAVETTIARSHTVTVALQWPGLILLGWAVGVLLLLALVLWQIVSVRRSLSRSRPAGPRMIGLLEECCAELGVTTRVRLRLTDEVRSPAVSGFWRPVILLPAVLPPGLWPDGLRTILTHELAHIKIPLKNP
jgi:bla regulator protein BlaR1